MSSPTKAAMMRAWVGRAVGTSKVTSAVALPWMSMTFRSMRVLSRCLRVTWSFWGPRSSWRVWMMRTVSGVPRVAVAGRSRVR